MDREEDEPMTMAMPETPEQVVPYWHPQRAGDRVYGVIIAIDTLKSQYGPYRVLTVQTKSGKQHRIRAWGKVLERALYKAVIGQFLSIRFLGTAVAGMSGREYRNYQVDLDAGTSWSTSNYRTRKVR
jgi:hypothetical protein